MTENKTVDELADEWVWSKICYGGLEYIRSGETYKNCVASFTAGYAARDAEVQELKNAVEFLKTLLAEKESSHLRIANLSEALAVAEEVMKLALSDIHRIFIVGQLEEALEHSIFIGGQLEEALEKIKAIKEAK